MTKERDGLKLLRGELEARQIEWHKTDTRWPGMEWEENGRRFTCYCYWDSESSKTGCNSIRISAREGGRKKRLFVEREVAIELTDGRVREWPDLGKWLDSVRSEVNEQG